MHLSIASEYCVTFLLLLQLLFAADCTAYCGCACSSAHAGHGPHRVPHGAQEQLWAAPHHRAKRCHGQLEVRAADLAACCQVRACAHTRVCVGSVVGIMDMSRPFFQLLSGGGCITEHTRASVHPHHVRAFECLCVCVSLSCMPKCMNILRVHAWMCCSN